MRKILHIVEPLVAGIHTFLVELTSRQCCDHDVYVAYNIRPQTPPEFKDYFDERIHWIKVENFQQSIGFKDIKAFFELRYILHKVNPDIIHLHSSKAGFLGRWAYNCSKYKVFYTPHGFSFLIQDISRFKRLFYWFIEYISAHRETLIIACGKGEYKEALKLSKNCVYVNNSINIDNLKPFVKNKPSTNQTPMACITGRISYQKNPILFNEIAKLLPQMKFIWIGDGELKNKLTSSNIEITGWKDRESAIKLVADADFFLLPSLWEGLPLSLLEAMYLKKICLVSNVIGNRDMIDHGRNGFICHSAEEYTQRINQILHSKHDWKAMTEYAHNDIITSHNTDLMAVQYKSIYAQY
jgi:glycosyltransferase involved in cell wall biosynthesis